MGCGTKPAGTPLGKIKLYAVGRMNAALAVCAIVEVRLALACHGFEGLLPLASVTCSRLFNQMAILVRSKAHQRRKGSRSVPGLVHWPCPASYVDPVWGAGTFSWCNSAVGKLQTPGGENTAAEICPKSPQMLFPPQNARLEAQKLFHPPVCSPCAEMLFFPTLPRQQ